MTAIPTGRCTRSGSRAAIYVLHVFQKKAKRGIATPRQETDLVKRRLKAVEQHDRDTYGEGSINTRGKNGDRTRQR